MLGPDVLARTDIIDAFGMIMGELRRRWPDDGRL